MTGTDDGLTSKPDEEVMDGMKTMA